MSDKRLEAALRYARMGWHVFPAPPGKKKSYKSANLSNGRRWGMTKDEMEIRGDFARWPDANVGLPTGRENGFWVMEMDTPQGHSVDGLRSLLTLEAEHGQLPRTRRAVSPSGSVHVYFTWPENAEIRNSTSAIAPGIDVRGEGGMVIAPPSVRHDGEYKWIDDCDTVMAPDWVVTAALAVSRRQQHQQVEANVDVDMAKVQRAMEAIPNADLDWENWNRIAMALWRTTQGSQEGFAMFDAWSQKSRKYNYQGTLDKWNALTVTPPLTIGVGTLYYTATLMCPSWNGVGIDDFYAYMPAHNYIFVPTRETWPVASINSCIAPIGLVDGEGRPINDDQGRQKRIKASAWLDSNKPVQQMTWAPGFPLIIADSLVSDGGWIQKHGVSTFNLYRPPIVEPGDGRQAGPWIDHCERVLGDDVEHVIKWLAHRVQRPQEKINHALLIGGAPGVGKDTLFEPVKYAVGHWNFIDVSPHHMMGRFNGYLKSVILRVNEARDLGELNRYQYYEHMKPFTASPPDVLRIDEKNLREYYIFNCTGVIETTNYKQDGVYLPPDDRRHYVTWCELTKDDFTSSYWNDLWRWYHSGGCAHVAAYLKKLDLSQFDPKMPPNKTEAFWAIVNANRDPEENNIADAIDRIGNPNVLTVHMIVAESTMEVAQWFTDRRNRRIIPHRLEKCGYVMVDNPNANDGVWKMGGRRTTIYGKTALSQADRIVFARELVASENLRVVS